jgi:hypothetical protein
MARAPSYLNQPNTEPWLTSGLEALVDRSLVLPC